jgi:hypothetical protein
MANSPETHSEVKNRLGKEYEDPHYHDEEAVPLDDDGQPRILRPPTSRKPARRIPPPKRRFYED